MTTYVSSIWKSVQLRCSKLVAINIIIYFIRPEWPCSDSDHLVFVVEIDVGLSHARQNSKRSLRASVTGRHSVVKIPTERGETPGEHCKATQLFYFSGFFVPEATAFKTLYSFFFFVCLTARRPAPDGDQPLGARLVVHRLRGHVENHQTGGRPPGIFHSVQTVRRPVADVRPPSRAAAAIRVLRPHVGRLRDTE